MNDAHRNRGSRWLLTAAMLLVSAAPASGQFPPPENEDGELYLPVNINPTEIPPVVNINPTNTPPEVNINPRGRTPSVNVGQLPPVTIAGLPEVRIRSMPPVEIETPGCGDQSTFRSAVEPVVAGPIRLTYLGTGGDAAATFVDGASESAVVLPAGPALGGSIYLENGQVLRFGEAVFYSGCVPS